MKSKLVKYPFNDGKRYRWDTWKMGKEFEYSWRKIALGDYDSIAPYIKTEPFNTNSFNNGEYAVVDLSKNIDAFDWNSYAAEFGLKSYLNSTYPTGQNLLDFLQNVGWAPSDNNCDIVKFKNSQAEINKYYFYLITSSNNLFSAYDYQQMIQHNYDVNKMVRHILEERQFAYNLDQS